MIEDKKSNKIKEKLSKVMTDRVRKFLGEVCQLEAEAASEDFDTLIGVVFTHADLQSPIEGLLYIALQHIFLDYREDPRLHISLQEQIGEYRVDFLIEFWSSVPQTQGNTKQLKKEVCNRAGVECNGHEWDEKTKEQARRDKQRDRILQSAGFKVLRYTGTEIYADPLKCARQIYGIVTDRESNY